jgi:hypothetical protein
MELHYSLIGGLKKVAQIFLATSVIKKNCPRTGGGVVYIVVSSLPATEETGSKYGS